MGLGESLNSFITYIQYLFILIKTKITLPFDWYDKIQPYVLIVLNFDWSSFDPPPGLGFLKTLRFDYRVQYIIVCCFIPLFTTLGLVTVFGDNATVVLFTGTAAGTFTIIFALFVVPSSWSVYMYIAAIACFVVALVGLLFSGAGRLLIGLYSRFFGKKNKNSLKDELENRASGDYHSKEKASIFTKYAFFFSILRFTTSAIIYAVIAVVFSSLVRSSLFTSETFTFEERLFNQSRSYVGIIISVICVIQVILNLGSLIFVLVSKLFEFLHKFQKFHTVRRHLVFFIQKFTLKIIFLILTVLYTPIISTILDSFFCKDYTCPKGTVFRDRYDSYYYQYSAPVAYSPYFNATYHPNVCMPCDFSYNATCATGVNGICGIDETRSMMRKNPSIQCATLTNFYAYGGIALLIVYAIGVPAVIFLLITIATQNLRSVNVRCLVENAESSHLIGRIWEKIKAICYWPIGKAIYLLTKLLQLIVRALIRFNPLPFVGAILKGFDSYLEESLDGEINEIWMYRAQFSNNLLRDTYAHFEYRMRYFLVWEILLKLVITSCSIALPVLDQEYFQGSTNYAMIIMALIQVFAAATLIITSPYMVFLEDIVATLLQIVTALNFVYGVLNFFLPEASWLSYFLFLNLAVPVLAVVNTVLFFCIKQITKHSLKNKKIGDVKKQIAEEEEKELVSMNDVPITPKNLKNSFGKNNSTRSEAELMDMNSFHSTPNVDSPNSPTLADKKRAKKKREKEKKEKQKALLKRIKEANDKEWDRIKEEVKEADERITRLGYFIVNTFFYLAGFITIIVLGFAMAGLADGTVNENMHDIILTDSGIEFSDCGEAYKAHFAGYGSFNQMAASCCCQPDPYLNDYRFNPREQRREKAELWTCPLDTDTKMRRKAVMPRVIKENNVLYSGLEIRDFCGKTFKSNYKLNCVAKDGNYRLVYANKTISNSYEPTIPEKYLF